MKLTKTQKDLILDLYNDHRDSCLTKGLRQANAALALAQDYPQYFECSQYGERYRCMYNFKIKLIGYMPDFLKEK